MGEHTIELTDGDFDEKTSKGEWIIDFWAAWCGPCKMMAPQFESAAKELKGKVNFGKVDVEENQELSQRFEVMSIPTIMLIKDGEIVNRTAGAMPKDSILGLISESF